MRPIGIPTCHGRLSPFPDLGLEPIKSRIVILDRLSLGAVDSQHAIESRRELLQQPTPPGADAVLPFCRFAVLTSYNGDRPE
jgi:hypothetical protein